MKRSTIAVGLALAMPATAFAGMGKVFPTYRAPPCSGDDCRADDPRSNKDCAGLLCTFSSAKAMSPPVTAAQAAEAERATAAAAPAEPVPAAPAKRNGKRVAKAKTLVTKTPAPKAPATATAAPIPATEAAR